MMRRLNADGRVPASAVSVAEYLVATLCRVASYYPDDPDQPDDPHHEGTPDPEPPHAA